MDHVVDRIPLDFVSSYDFFLFLTAAYGSFGSSRHFYYIYHALGKDTDTQLEG
jgi:hypothetical protein